MKKYLNLLLASSALLLATQKLSAESAIDFTGSGTVFTNGFWSLGFEFNVANSVSINGLGFFDSYKNGLTESHDVGLWDSSGTLLASATVTNANALDGWFRYADIGTLTLGAGNYTIGAVTGTEDYAYNVEGFSTAPGITYVANRYISSTTLARPTETDSNLGWFGGNVRLTNSVPDSGLTWLMMAGGLGLIAAVRRKLR